MSLRKAINDKCKDCIYDPLAGTGNWRKQVHSCIDTACPLHPYWPMSVPRQKQAKCGVPEALRQYWEGRRGSA
jgi:hypothetical protein